MIHTPTESDENAINSVAVTIKLLYLKEIYSAY